MKIVAITALLLAVASAETRLDFQKGHKYIYEYEGLITNAIPTGAANTLGLRLKCQCNVDAVKASTLQITLDNIEIHKVTGQRDQEQYEKLDKDVEQKIKDYLSKPIHAKLSGGLVKQIDALVDDVEWSLNMKRGIVNLLQVAPANPEEETLVKQIERTFVGECQVAYNVWPKNSDAKQDSAVTKVTKVINYDKCRNRPQLRQSMFPAEMCDKCQKSINYAPYLRSVGHIEYELETIPEGTIIKKAWGKENHVFTPHSEQGGHASAKVRQMLTYVKVQKSQAALAADLTKKTGLLFVPENPDESFMNDKLSQKWYLHEITELIAKLPNHIKEENVSPESAEIFSTIVYDLRQCNNDTLTKVLKKALDQKDIKTRQICLDALSVAGTKQVFETLRDNIGSIPKEDMSRILLGLPMTHQWSKEHLDILWKLCEAEPVASDMNLRRHCLMGFGVLVRKFNLTTQVVQKSEVRMALDTYFQNIITNLTSAKTVDEKLTLIKTIGNSGEASFLPALFKLLRDRQQMEMVRVECIWALRHIQRDYPERVAPLLFPIFANPQESPELRMAIFVTLLNLNPTLLNMQTLVNIVVREITAPSPQPRSNQVASFVMSHLSALAFHNNLITKQRSMYARLVLRQMPRVNFDLSYSKGVRLAMYSAKLQAGKEWEFNKVNVPESFLPRSVNTKLRLHLLGFRFNAIEFGARMEGIHDVVAKLISEIRSRQKRSLWGSLWASWFENSATKSPTSRPTSRATTRPTSAATPSVSTKRPTLESDGEKNQQVSAYLKLFGSELKFVHFKKSDIQQMVKDIDELMQRKKQEIKYPKFGITINRNGVDISSELSKAFVAVEARQMIPTFVGIPLHLNLHTSLVTRAKVHCTLRTDSSIWNFFKMTGMSGDARVTPSAAVFVHGRMGLHTPWVRAGVMVNSRIHSEHVHKMEWDMTFGKKYEVKYHHPERKMEVFHMQSDVQGYVESIIPKTGAQDLTFVDMKVDKQHMVKVAPTCKPINLLGMKVCYEAQVPDMASTRLPTLPIFPALELSRVRLAIDRAEDKPECVSFNVKSIQKEEQGWKCDAQISVSSSQVKRLIPIHAEFDTESKELTVNVSKIEAPTYQGDEVWQFTSKFAQLKNWESVLEFGQKKMYRFGFQTAIEDMGRRVRIQATWNDLPQDWKDWIYYYEPQIYYYLQQFASVTRPKADDKKLVIVFQLNTDYTAALRIQSSKITAERSELALPITITRFPQSVAEIKDYFYATCEVKSDTIQAFDQVKYQNKLQQGSCHILTRDQISDQQEPRYQVSLRTSGQGQRTLSIELKKLGVQVDIQGNAEKVLINGEECKEDQCSQKGVTVRKQSVQGQNKISVSTPHGLHVSVDGQKLRLQASPMLRRRVRGLCGDADGEQWNDLRTPQNKILSRQHIDEFIKSWKC